MAQKWCRSNVLCRKGKEKKLIKKNYSSVWAGGEKRISEFPGWDGGGEVQGMLTFRFRARITIVYKLLSWQISVLFSLPCLNIWINYESTKKSLCWTTGRVVFFKFFSSLFKIFNTYQLFRQNIRIQEWQGIGRTGRMGRIHVRVNFFVSGTSFNSHKQW